MKLFSLLNRIGLISFGFIFICGNMYGQPQKDTASIATLTMQELEVVASFAKTKSDSPASISNISKEQIKLQSPAAEFPELLNSAAYSFASRQGGGFGDSRITLRGFGSENISLLINGVPVNGAENGSIYWSNWMALADVAQKIQIQRGIGLSSLGQYSVGGTINIITDLPQNEMSGSFYTGTGNDGYLKTSLNFNTGESSNGWSATMMGSYTRGDGYVTATRFESWTYYLSIVKRFGQNHRLTLTAFGSPQWHHRRSNKHMIEDYENHPDGIRMNTSYGYMNGKITPTYSGFNKYHKPQIALRHYWNISEGTNLSTTLYGSVATGGGRKVLGIDANRLQYNYKTGKPNAQTDMAPDGTIDYEPVMEANGNSVTGSRAIFALGTNSHRNIGLISVFSKEMTENILFTAGLDASIYSGDHYDKITDLLGGEYYIDKNLAWRDPDTHLGVGDKVTQDYVSRIKNVGVYAQVSYKSENVNAFLTAGISDKMYQRHDPGRYGKYGNTALYPEDEKDTSYKHFKPMNIKGGVNLKLSEHQNVYANLGYVTRAPMFENVFVYNDFAPNAQNEKIATAEIGYGYANDKVSLWINGYMTKWQDKSTIKAIGTWNGPKACIPSIDALHKGIEIEAGYKPTKSIAINLSTSFGDWKWLNDVSYSYYNESGEHVGDFNAYINDLHVGNAPQTSIYGSVEWSPLDGRLRLMADVNYYGRRYADFSPDARNNKDDRMDSWKMSDYSVVNISGKYTLLKSGKRFNVDLYGNINNLLDEKYISDATDGANHNAETSYVWYGIGRTWNLGMRIRF